MRYFRLPVILFVLIPSSIFAEWSMDIRGVRLKSKPFVTIGMAAEMNKVETAPAPPGYQCENLFSNNPRSECDTRPTYHVHAGGEYLFGWNKFDIPLRMGVFYDPEPTDYKPDDFWGFGMGTGLRIKDKYSLDLAWQFRWGNHVRKARLLNENVYQDIRQHMVYCSLTYYFSD
jgi:hypothetical protein